jgi:hypothetical protein
MNADRSALRDRIVALYLLDKRAYADVVDAAIDLIRDEVLEEAAGEMERLNIYNAAAAIRALKGDT